jgi:hypothetical protein
LIFSCFYASFLVLLRRSFNKELTFNCGTKIIFKRTTLSAASRQPPAASRQPPAASRQPPAASRQLMADGVIVAK